MQSPGQKIFSLYTQWKDGELPGKSWLSQVSRWIMGVASIDSSITVKYTPWNINLQINQDWIDNTQSIPVAAQIVGFDQENKTLICDIYRDGIWNSPRNNDYYDDVGVTVYLRQDMPLIPPSWMMGKFIWVSKYFDQSGSQSPNPKWYALDIVSENAPVLAKILSFTGQNLTCDIYRDGPDNPVRDYDDGITVKCPHTIDSNNKLSNTFIWVSSYYDIDGSVIRYYCNDFSKVVDFGTITDADAIDLAPEIAINNGYLQVRCKKIRFKIDDSTTPPQLKIFKTTVDGAWSTGIDLTVNIGISGSTLAATIAGKTGTGVSVGDCP